MMFPSLQFFQHEVRRGQAMYFAGSGVFHRRQAGQPVFPKIRSVLVPSAQRARLTHFRMPRRLSQRCEQVMRLRVGSRNTNHVTQDGRMFGACNLLKVFYSKHDIHIGTKTRVVSLQLFQLCILESSGHVESRVWSGCGKCFTEHPVEYLEFLRCLSVSLWRYSSSMLVETRHRRLGFARLTDLVPSSFSRLC